MEIYCAVHPASMTKKNGSRGRRKFGAHRHALARDQKPEPPFSALLIQKKTKESDRKRGIRSGLPLSDPF